MVINDGIGIEWVDGFRFVPTGGSVVLGRVSTAGADRRVITQSIGSEPHLGIDGSRGLSRLGVRLRPTEQGVVVEALSMNHTVKVKEAALARVRAGSWQSPGDSHMPDLYRVLSSNDVIRRGGRAVLDQSLQPGFGRQPPTWFDHRSSAQRTAHIRPSESGHLGGALRSVAHGRSRVGKGSCQAATARPQPGGKGSQAAIKTVRRRLDSEMKRVADYLGESEPATNKVPWLARRLLLHHLVREDELHDIVSLVETRSREASS